MPVPPYDVPVNHTGQLIMTILVVIALLVAAVSAVRMGRRLSSWGPVATLVGSLIAGFIEPMYCVTMHLWYYTPGQWNMYSAFGQSQPIWSWLSYGAFYGGLTLLVWWRVEQGATASSVWRLAGVLVAIGIATEIVCIRLGTYEYYGAHPFRVASFPLWISVANSAIGIVGGIIAARLRRALTGHQAWAMVVLVPAVMPAIQIGTNFLALDVISNANPSTVLMYAAAIVSMAASVTTVYLAIKMLPARPTRTADGPSQRVTAA
ncbi:hypothetical protein ABIA30_005148 [Mycobacterium sp. MAA66]|uniref:hypothetical protein n=1 Tax=Mycobacterium sp. MAA66 TaxID=3156297 RepID=UPI003513F0CF